MSERGQATAEFVLAMPILILIFFGMYLAGLYAFRAAAADWGVFISAAAGGAYSSSAGWRVRSSIAWTDIANQINTAPLGNEHRQVRSRIDIVSSRPWVFGINLEEAQRGTAYFRLWQFYAGPPTGEIE